MKKLFTIATSLLLSSMAISAQTSQTFPTFRVTASVDNDNDIVVFNIRQNTGWSVTSVSGCGFIQLSKYNDFRSTDYIKRFTTSGTTISSSAKELWTIEGAELEPGEYYWRVFYLKTSDDNKIPYTGSKAITFGSKETDSASEVAEDITVYDDVKLNNDIELSIEPVWLRSDNANAHLPVNYYINPSATTPNLLNTARMTYVPYTHGIVVRNNIIYTPCGAINPINWNFEKTQLELDRYNLQTGESLERAIVKSNEGIFDGQSAMSLLAEDTDGTIYFTTTKFDNNNLSSVYLYTIAIPEDADEENPTLYANLQQEFSMTENTLSTKNSHIFVVEGSIADKNYTLWGSSPYNKESVGNDLNDVVYRWIVGAKNTTFEYAFINEADLMTSDYKYVGGLSRITPLGNDNFYYHSIQNDDGICSITPALYSFNAEEHVCEKVSSAKEIADTHFSQLDHSILGISRTYFENRPIVAFGQSSENGSHIGIAELTADDEMSFKDANLLWILNQDGFSKNQQQGCDIKLIDNPMTTFADETPSSKLMLAYMPNAGMGLYNVTAVNTTGINDIIDDNTQCNFILQGRILYVTAPVKCTLTNMSGYQYAFNPTNMQVDLSSLASGLYILQFEGDSSANKVVLK